MENLEQKLRDADNVETASKYNKIIPEDKTRVKDFLIFGKLVRIERPVMSL